MVLCGTNAFTQETTAQSICKLPETNCNDRYDNLQQSMVRRAATLFEEERQEVERSETTRHSSDLGVNGLLHRACLSWKQFSKFIFT